MVRCGSCQEIFDATKHLTSGMPSEAKPVRTPPPPVAPKAAPLKTTTQPPAPAPVKKPPAPEPPFRFDDPDEHEHIDLSIPITRENMPDQTPFMDSIYDEHSPYNNLDEMGAIHIPGELDFGDSIIKFVVDRKEPDEEIHIEEPISEQPTHTGISEFDEIDADLEIEGDTHPQPAINVYEDTEDKEEPASSMERDAIDNLYKFADDELNDDKALAKNIEELLLYASDLDNKTTRNKPAVDSGFDDLDDFEKELDNLNLQSPLPFDQPAKKPVPIPDKSAAAKQTEDEDEFEDFADFDIDFDDDETQSDAIAEKAEPADVVGATVAPDEAEEIEITDVKQPTRPRPAPAQTAPAKSAATNIEEEEDELPSAEFEIPKALRSSFDKLAAPTRPIGLSIALGFAILVLVLGFMFQLIFFRSYELANSFPTLNPLLTSLCGTLPCRYSGSIDVSKIELLNRDVRSHPSQKNALLISTAFINNARFDQPYPTIAVKLSDLSGNIVATRHFKPEEYLESLYSKFLLMEAGTPIHITLAVLDPGEDAINFEFSFLQ